MIIDQLLSLQKKSYRSVNVRYGPALHCKGPQILGQCLTNISSGHPRSVRGCGISFERSLEKPISHKYVDAKRRSIFKAMSLPRMTKEGRCLAKSTVTLQLLFHV